METKIIDGKEYTKVGIKELSINGEKSENLFSLNDINNQSEISFDIQIDYNVENNPTSFTTNSLDSKNIKLNNNIEISDIPTPKTPIDTSHNTDTSSSKNISNSSSNSSSKEHKIDYLYYVICALGLAGLLYFLFIK